jgi:YesN/AraC family two-component response regulator
MKIHIKYMVSLRCKLVVKDTLKSLGIRFSCIDLGEVNILDDSITEQKREELKTTLMRFGLELMDEKKSTIVERIKNFIIEMVHYSEELPRVKISIFLSKKLNHNYTYLSNLFKEVTGITIQHFIVLHKIEKAKELILYDELTLNEITDLLHYSSVAHLSSQFKKVTGTTPSEFKKENFYKKRIMLENI